MRQKALWFDFERREWQIRLSNISVHSTSGIDSIIAGTLLRLPPATLNAVRTLACLPSSDVPISVLAQLVDQNENTLRSDLLKAVDLGLISMSPNGIQFCHDKQHAAALSALNLGPDAADQRLAIARKLEALDNMDVYIHDVVHNIIVARDMGKILPIVVYVPICTCRNRMP